MPSEYNSADNLTRVRTVNDLFSDESTWFTPHPSFNQPGIPYFDRVQIKKVSDNVTAAENELKIAAEIFAITKNDVKEIEPKGKEKSSDSPNNLKEATESDESTTTTGEKIF